MDTFTPGFRNKLASSGGICQMSGGLRFRGPH
jgi:hypothetical protein